jgi:NAD(P)H-dependent glutamate synthase small subunit
MEHRRKNPSRRPVAERIGDWREIEQPLPPEEVEIQATRCRDCGVPYCHSYGCPLSNRIPDWNLMVAGKSWKQALDLLHATNNFPEITGRVCPALCESACTLSINMPAVSIRHVELQIVERGWEKGWIEPRPALSPTGKRVAVIGSGPAGLAAAQELARKGHAVTVYEKDDRIGGILRYGIPDFKLEKRIIDRRLDQLRAEGVVFETGVSVGTDLSARYLQRTFDAILIAAGARVPRDLQVPGRDLEGIHFAMDFLSRQNRMNAGDLIPADSRILATGKNVLVVGGGDTGSDCVGTSRRQGAGIIYQMEILPQPPETRLDDNPWPSWPLILRTSSSHEEGCERLWAVTVKEFIGEGSLHAVRLAKVEWFRDNGRSTFREIPGSEFELEVGLALLAMGFLHTEHGPLVTELGLSTDSRGNLAVNESLMTSAPGIFAAGDSVSGASLVVRAMEMGRRAAEGIGGYLRRG